MSEDASKQIKFAWWNTSLAPSAKSRSTPEQREVARTVIAHLIIQNSADFIALGEMSEDDFNFISEACKTEGYVFVSEITSTGRSRFDICYIYNSEKMYIFSSKDVTSKRGNSVLKVAKQIHAIVEGSTAPFHIYISHWPSRLWCHQHDADRHLLGIRLRDSLNNLMEETTTKPFVVLLGDYNDEPFDESLSHQLMASRDLDLVHKRQHLLYNPFWKYLSKIKNEHTFAGSYYYKGGEVTRWHTFDQVIFSHAFIEGKEWRLSNDCEHIIEFPPYTQLVKDPDSKFDHLPVYATIERVKDHG